MRLLGIEHVRVLQNPEVDHVVAIDTSEERLLSLRQTFPDLLVRSSLDLALDDVDALIRRDAAHPHADVAEKAMTSGKGVLVEKPLATSTEDALRLTRAAEKGLVTLMVGHTFEHNAAVWKLRELIQSEVLGRIFYLDSARLNLGLTSRT